MELRSALSNDRPSFFIQPHFDDVALSCGATAAAAAARGATSHVLTVFGSDIVPKMVGDFAQWKHDRWKLTDIDAVIRVRREEDACAMRVLGCTFRWLGLPDAIYRVDRYSSDAELYGALREEEVGLAIHLAEEIVSLPEWAPGTRVFVPLAVGSHVDHQIAFEAGRCMAINGAEVWAYEDLPYGIHSPHAVATRLSQVAGTLGEMVDWPAPETLAAKLEAISCYTTQIQVIFRFTDDWRQAVSQHALARGAGERFWRVRG